MAEFLRVSWDVILGMRMPCKVHVCLPRSEGEWLWNGGVWWRMPAGSQASEERSVSLCMVTAPRSVRCRPHTASPLYVPPFPGLSWVAPISTLCSSSLAGRTRLLYRMSLDFLGWTRNLPGIDAFWKSIAEQVWGCASMDVSVGGCASMDVLDLAWH